MNLPATKTAFSVLLCIVVFGQSVIDPFKLDTQKRPLCKQGSLDLADNGSSLNTVSLFNFRVKLLSGDQKPSIHVFLTITIFLCKRPWHQNSFSRFIFCSFILIMQEQRHNILWYNKLSKEYIMMIPTRHSVHPPI